MANMKHFAGLELLTGIQHDGSPFTGAKHFSGLNSQGVRVQSDRMIEFKRNPSLHKCDARCQNAKGFKCECSCRGAHHGVGASSLICEAA